MPEIEDRLLEKAAVFLKNHPEINEVEVTEGNISVHVVRWSPQPMTYAGTWVYPGQSSYQIK